MFNSLKARFALIAALLLLSGWLIVQRGITLGLDLQGGTHLALEVRDPSNALTDVERADAIDRALTIIRTRVDELGVAEPTIQKVGDDRIIVELPGTTQEEQQRAKDVIQQAAFLQFQIVRPLSDLQGVLPRIDRVVAQNLGARASPAPADAAQPGLGGLFEAAPDSAAQDTTAPDTAAGAAPTGDSAAPVVSSSDSAAGTGEGSLSSRLLPAGGTGGEAIFAVAEQDVDFVRQALALPEVRQMLPRGSELAWGVEQEGAQAAPYRSLYLLEDRPLMTGEELEDAQAMRDPQLGQPIVTFQLTRRGGREFERGTGANIGRLMAIVLDEQVISAPVIQSQIGTNGQITMAGGGIEEASDLALVLRAGALPAPIEIVEERSVGPSLGADSIEKGRIAGMIALVAVVLILVSYYRLAGAMAVVALTLYVVLILGALAGIDANLTLPGIAGIVLSIGMSVDANVLIFERIREELDAGRNPRTAVSEGFSNALSAIVDGQLTTLLTALVLFQFGTGPVRGFAVTLALGIIASLFSAIFVTRTLFMMYLNRRTATQGLSI